MSSGGRVIGELMRRFGADVPTEGVSMTDCQAEVGKWRGHDLYVCETCNIRTVDPAAYQKRCQSQRQPPEPTSTAGLYGPSGDPLPKPEPDTEPGSHDGAPTDPEQPPAAPRSHDDI